MANKTICLDAGHTPGEDPGACAFGLKEANITGDIVGRIATALAAYNCTVLQVPRTDSLQARCAYANGQNADCFVSVHIIAGGGTGFESYTYVSPSARTITLREFLHEACASYSAQHGLVDRGRKTAPFIVLGETSMPAVLLELCFIDNSIDAALLRDELYLSGISSAIAHGIAKAMGLSLRETDETAATKTAIERLQAKGIIVSPDYWLDNANPGGSCKGEYVAALIRNFASKI